MKIDLFPDEVYVFTPKGAVRALPSGATAVDLAYAVHTDIGDGCVACRIDRNLAPLSTVLQSGQTVEIITAPGAYPNPNWLNFVVTAKARSSIRHFLKGRQHGESVELGRHMLDKALLGLGSNLGAVNPAVIEQMVQETRKSTFDNVLGEIGSGIRVAMLTARRLLGRSENADSTSPATSAAPLAIRGKEGMVGFGKCCYPIPGDGIVGHISAGRGVVVHRDHCNNVAELLRDSTRAMALRWADETVGEFSVELLIDLENHKGVIAALANRISGMDVDIEKLSVEERDDQYGQAHLIIAVRNRVHLAHVIRRIRTLSTVTKVARAKH